MENSALHNNINQLRNQNIKAVIDIVKRILTEQELKKIKKGDI